VDGPLHSSMGSNKDTSKPKSVLDNCKKNWNWNPKHILLKLKLKLMNN
jgi:hypothetical protein